MRRTFEVVRKITPGPGQTAAHVEFDKSGRHALVSVRENDGALVIYDAEKFVEEKRIPMAWPSGKYNVEQDQPVRRNEPLRLGRRPFGLLLAAHGERGAGADNAGVVSLAQRLASEGIAAEVVAGFIKGTPTLDDAIRALASRDVVVYPLFLADGYFTRIALPRLIDQARHDDSGRIIKVLPPLGLEPALVDVIADEAMAAAHVREISPEEITVVLLAHGSASDKASRAAARQLADRLHERRRVREIRVALLEETPSLAEAAKDVCGPVVVVGLFAGEGMHGVEDAKRLVAELAREDVILIGPVGTFAGVAALIGAAVVRHRLTQP